LIIARALIRDAVRWRLRSLKGEYGYVEISKGGYEKLQQAIKGMEMPFLSVSDFIDQQIKSLLEKYAEWTVQREVYEEENRKGSLIKNKASFGVHARR